MATVRLVMKWQSLLFYSNRKNLPYFLSVYEPFEEAYKLCLLIMLSITLHHSVLSMEFKNSTTKIISLKKTKSKTTKIKFLSLDLVGNLLLLEELLKRHLNVSTVFPSQSLKRQRKL